MMRIIPFLLVLTFIAFIGISPIDVDVGPPDSTLLSEMSNDIIDIDPAVACEYANLIEPVPDNIKANGTDLTDFNLNNFDMYSTGTTANEAMVITGAPSNPKYKDMNQSGTDIDLNVRTFMNNRLNNRNDLVNLPYATNWRNREPRHPLKYPPDAGRQPHNNQNNMIV